MTEIQFLEHFESITHDIDDAAISKHPSRPSNLKRGNHVTWRSGGKWRSGIVENVVTLESGKILVTFIRYDVYYSVNYDNWKFSPNDDKVYVYDYGGEVPSR